MHEIVGVPRNISCSLGFSYFSTIPHLLPYPNTHLCLNLCLSSNPSSALISHVFPRSLKPLLPSLASWPFWIQVGVLVETREVSLKRTFYYGNFQMYPQQREWTNQPQFSHPCFISPPLATDLNVFLLE